MVGGEGQQVLDNLRPSALIRFDHRVVCGVSKVLTPIRHCEEPPGDKKRVKHPVSTGFQGHAVFKKAVAEGRSLAQLCT